MENKTHPTLGNGKICYIELPATDIAVSVAFYQNVFGWHVRRRGDGSMAFDDGVNQVSGTWVLGRKPAGEPGLLFYIMVDNAEKTLELIIQYGGKVTQQVGVDFPEITARFSDPAGNVIGIFEQQG